MTGTALLASFISFLLGDAAALFADERELRAAQLAEALGKQSPAAHQGEGAYWCALLFAALALGVCAGFVIWSLRRKSSGSVKNNFAIPVLCAAFLVVGFALTRSFLHRADGLRVYLGRNAALTGTIETDTVKPVEGGTFLTLRVELAQSVPETSRGKNNPAEDRAALWKQTRVQGRVRVFVAGGGNIIWRGRLQVRGKLEPVIGHANPGSRSRELYARRQMLVGSIRTRAADALINSRASGAREHIASGVQELRTLALKFLPERTGPLLLGMTLGGYEGVAPGIGEALRANGLSHLMAVSGTHVTLLAAILLGVLKPLGRFKRLACVTLLLVLYACACGFSPSVVRAVLMSLALLWSDDARTPVGECCAAEADGLRRKVDRGRLLLFTAWGMLLIRPAWLADPGFQLSFLTVLGLVLLRKKLRAYLPECCPDFLADGLAVSLSCQLAIVPVVTAYFHQLSLIGILSNVLLTPGLAAAALCCAAGCVLLWAPPAANLLFCFADFLAQGALSVAFVLARLPGADIDAGRNFLISGLAYYAALAVFFDLGGLDCLNCSERKRTLAICLAVILAGRTWYAVRPAPFSVTALDVGNGDAFLLETPERKRVLIDTGGLKNYDTGSSIVAPALRCMGIGKLDALVLSHGDLDHAGGAAGVARSMEIDNIFLSDAEESEHIAALLKIKNGARVHRVGRGDSAALKDLRLNFLAGGKAAAKLAAPGEKITANDTSLVLIAECGKRRALFGGDASSGVEKMLLQDDLKVDLLKLSHHGSAGSSSQEFLARTQPEIALVSVGRRNRYGHPSGEVLERLNAMGIPLLRTDVLGAVRVELREAGLKWYGYRFQPEKF